MCSIHHDLKAIYIHIPKTGGSYVSSVLSQYYGFKTYYLKRPDHNNFTKIHDKSVDKHENKLIGTFLYYSTSPHLNQIMNMNPHKWKSYRIFTFVRNPLDRIQSAYHYTKKKYYPQLTIDQFFKNRFQLNCWTYWHSFMSQLSHIVNEKNENICFLIGKQENLETDLRYIIETLGLKVKHTSFIKNKTHYQSTSIDHWKHLFLKDLEHFQY